jgi:hypothetical protein
MYRIIILILLIFFETISVFGQGDVVYIPDGSPDSNFAGTSFGSVNPYPGLGADSVTGEAYVVPGGTYTNYAGLPSALPTKTLLSEFSDENIAESTFSSTTKTGGELYLSRIPNGKRSGFFQKANFNALWSPNSGGQKGLGVTQLDLSAMFALPLPTADSPFLISPSFQSWFFDPKYSGYASDKTLYTTGLDFRWIKPVIKDKLTFDFGVATLYSGDFKVKGNKAMRFPAHIAGIWNCNPRLKVIFGVVYLDRNDDFNWLPMAGMIWAPQEDLSVEMVVPRIRIAQRIRWFGSAAGDDSSDWIYTAFEFGGGSWGYELEYANENLSGNIDYRDLKLLLGYERRCASGVMLGLELGYMFERKYEFDRTGYSTYPANCVFLRLRTSF